MSADRLFCRMPDPSGSAGNIEWDLPWTWDESLAWRFVEAMRGAFGDASLIVQRKEEVVIQP